MLNKIKVLDLFGKPVTLNVFGKKRHKTLVGAFVSISAMIFFVFAFQKKLIEFFQNVSINVNQRILRDSLDQIEINPKSLMFAFRFFDDEQSFSDKTTPYTFKIYQVTKNRMRDSQGLKDIIEKQSISIEPCTLQHFQEQLMSDNQVIQTFFEDVNVDQFVCPSINQNFTLQGNYNQATYKYIKQSYRIKL